MKALKAAASVTGNTRTSFQPSKHSTIRISKPQPVTKLPGPGDSTTGSQSCQPAVETHAARTSHEPLIRTASPLSKPFGRIGLAVCALALTQTFYAPAVAAPQERLSGEDTFENVPSQLSSVGPNQGPLLSKLLQGSKGRQVEGCTRKCVPTCIRGGEGAPGLGPITMRKEIVVFKSGFRSRQYCLSECAQVCSLAISGSSTGGNSSSSSEDASR
eukprot:jgi/Chrzof1/2370/Cz11g12180.t1